MSYIHDLDVVRLVHQDRVVRLEQTAAWRRRRLRRGRLTDGDGSPRAS